MSITKRSHHRHTLEIVAPQRFVTTLDPGFFKGYVSELGEIKKYSRFPTKTIHGYWLLANQPGFLVRWAWGWRLAKGEDQPIGGVNFSWICSLELTNVREDGLREGRLNTPRWEEIDGLLVDSDKYSISRRSLWERMRAEDPRFEMTGADGVRQ